MNKENKESIWKTISKSAQLHPVRQSFVNVVALTAGIVALERTVEEKGEQAIMIPAIVAPLVLINLIDLYMEGKDNTGDEE